MCEGLDNWVVLYRDESLLPLDAPLAFCCRAEDGDHADEQCVDASPGCEVVWSFLGDVDDAYREYWSWGGVKCPCKN